MKKKIKLVLHLGLHKTASTSLQFNVFYSLHQEGKINYLGNVRNIKKTIYNPFSIIFNEIISEKSIKTIDILRLKTEKLLHPTKLNVLSEENFSSSLTYKIDTIYNNLSKIFINCDIKCLISLRSPLDMFYSMYVEFYYWIFFLEVKRNTFEKFIKHFVSNSKSEEYIQFFYEKTLHLLKKYFKNTTVLLYEDLIFDKNHYFSSLSNILKVDKKEIENKFLVEKLNTKTTKTLNKQSYPLTLQHFIHKKIFFLKKLLKKITWLHPLLIFLFNLLKFIPFPLAKPIIHFKPDKISSTTLFELLKIKNLTNFSKKYNLSKVKLIKYKYGEKN